jgi:hypothetical protein
LEDTPELDARPLEITDLAIIHYNVSGVLNAEKPVPD